MTASVFYDLVRFYSTQTGTGSTVSIGAAVAGFRTPAQAGIPNGTQCDYSIIDGSAWEFGTFIYNTATPNLTRTPVGSSNSNAAINLSGNNQIVNITALSASIVNKKGDTISGQLVVSDTTTSTTPSNGALTVTGGAGVGGPLNVGGNLSIGAANTGAIFSALGNTSAGAVNFDFSNNAAIAVSNEVRLRFPYYGSLRALPVYAPYISFVETDTGGAGDFAVGLWNGGGLNERFRVSAAGGVKFNAFGAGSLSTDSSGNVSATSDETLKIIHGSFSRGLEALQGIKPILHSWTKESGMETEGIYAGFSAQNVRRFIPEAVGTMADGKLTLADRPLLAALVNAVNALDAEIASLKSRLAAN